MEIRDFHLVLRVLRSRALLTSGPVEMLGDYEGPALSIAFLICRSD
jgi:hypothetical protein